MANVWCGSTEEECWASSFIGSLMTRSWRKVERFFLRLQGRGVQSEEDKMVGEKEGNFFVKQLYNELEPGGHVDF